MREKRTFTDDEIAHALAVLRGNGGNAKKTALALGISRTTLRGWAGRHSNQTGTSKHVNESRVDRKGEKLALTLEEISAEGSRRVLEAIKSVKLETAADVRNMLVGVGITTEKASFARGGPTSRTESLRVSMVDPSALAAGTFAVLEGGKKQDKGAA